MNLILFESTETDRPLPRADRRAVHIMDVLRRAPGDTFDVGLVNGPRGKATLVALGADDMELTFQWGPAPPPAAPITLVVGLTRPQTARDILRDATTLGVREIHFVRTEKSEASYAHSSLWSSGEWRRHLLTGAEQAFDTCLPDVTHDLTLAEAMAQLPSGAVRLACDNYESPGALGEVEVSREKHYVIAIGAERGWSARERDALRAQQFSLVHLGPRVLRAETAVLAAVAILRAKFGLM
ncbi:16S rRNA (uracil(1498)-N(3))-methyltransferase [Horticoccus sp. 23ND18S-11]|uniref:16S rRNA (uracil(1498)-N(3))-methyltransferase n=1 Tax=Horticoccus sp. 23ND18S-11 TaxID=3391832 RepID=UPI0039C91F72